MTVPQTRTIGGANWHYIPLLEHITLVTNERQRGHKFTLFQIQRTF